MGVGAGARLPASGAAQAPLSGRPSGAGGRPNNLRLLAAYVAALPTTRLLFADEAWWGLTTEIGKVWARGPRPVLAVSGRRAWPPVLAAVAPATGRLVSLITGRFDATWFGHC